MSKATSTIGTGHTRLNTAKNILAILPTTFKRVSDAASTQHFAGFQVQGPSNGRGKKRGLISARVYFPNKIQITVKDFGPVRLDKPVFANEADAIKFLTELAINLDVAAAAKVPRESAIFRQGNKSAAKTANASQKAVKTQSVAIPAPPVVTAPLVPAPPKAKPQVKTSFKNTQGKTVRLDLDADFASQLFNALKKAGVTG